MEEQVKVYPSIMDGEEGAGMSTEAELAALSKALDTGDYVTAVAGTTNGAALRVQSLEGTLKVLTFSEKNAILWASINKLPAYSTVEEYDELNSYGSEGGSFVPQGVAPQEDDSVYTRRAAYVKYMGTLRKITHPMTLVNTVAGNIVDREDRNGTLKIIRDLENALFWGDSKRAYNNVEGLEFDGLFNKIDKTNDYDLGGQVMTEGSFEDLATIIADNYGNPTDIFVANKVATSFTKTMLPKGRAIYPSSGGGGGVRAGAIVNEVATAHGIVKINPSVFLNTGRSPLKVAPTAASSTLAPTAPKSIASGAATGTDGLFRSAQTGSAIKFAAVACNRFGCSAATALSAGITLASGDIAKHVPLTITNADAVTVVPEWFEIYATVPGGSVAYYIGMVPAASQANDGTTTYNYDGYIMPGTSVAFFGEFSPDVLTFKQLAPLMKMALAVIDPSIRWMILLYGVLQLYMPKRWARVMNIQPIATP